MKYILFILILLSVVGCTYSPVNDETKVSNKALEMLNDTQDSVVYIVNTSDAHYYFDSNKDLIEYYNVKFDEVSLELGLVILLIVICFFLGFLVGVFTDIQ